MGPLPCTGFYTESAAKGNKMQMSPLLLSFPSLHHHKSAPAPSQRKRSPPPSFKGTDQMASELLNVHQLFASPYSSHLHDSTHTTFTFRRFFKDCVKPTSSDFAYLRSSLWDIGSHVQTEAIRPNFAAKTICFPTFLWFYRAFTLPSNRSIFISGLYVFIPHNSRSPSTPAFHVYYIILTYDDIPTLAQVVAQYPCKLYTNANDTASYDFLHIGLQFSACPLEIILIIRYEDFINGKSGESCLCKHETWGRTDQSTHTLAAAPIFIAARLFIFFTWYRL